MVLNMDTELQRLICVSVEKMTRDPGSSGRGLPGSGSRKSRGLDLRKALLVAHVLQDMRSAYISDDYQVLVNTVCPELSSEVDMEDLRRTILRKDYDDVSESVGNTRKQKFLSEEWMKGTVERPPRSESDGTPFLTSQYRCPSGTQSCLMTCSDATMSKISQKTHPIPVSINTSYVLSHQASEKDDCDVTEVRISEGEMDDTPAVSEQVEVTSSNDSDSEMVETEIVNCDELNSASSVITNESDNLNKESTVTQQCSNLDKNKSQGITKSSITCPLPRKKRPLPKEFLEQEVEKVEQECKRTKVDATVTTTTCDATVVTSSCYLSNTTTATTLTQSIALSSAYSSLSPASQYATMQTSPCTTVTSSVCSTVSSSGSSSITMSSTEGPKVVVERNTQPSFHALWSWTLPSTCTQPRLSQWLLDGVYRTQMSEISKLRDTSIHNTNIPGLVAY